LWNSTASAGAQAIVSLCGCIEAFDCWALPVSYCEPVKVIWVYMELFSVI
jgi:hypothetical protein